MRSLQLRGRTRRFPRAWRAGWFAVARRGVPLPLLAPDSTGEIWPRAVRRGRTSADVTLVDRARSFSRWGRGLSLEREACGVVNRRASDQWIRGAGLSFEVG